MAFAALSCVDLTGIELVERLTTTDSDRPLTTDQFLATQGKELRAFSQEKTIVGFGIESSVAGLFGKDHGSFTRAGVEVSNYRKWAVEDAQLQSEVIQRSKEADLIIFSLANLREGGRPTGKPISMTEWLFTAAFKSSFARGSGTITAAEFFYIMGVPSIRRKTILQAEVTRDGRQETIMIPAEKLLDYLPQMRTLEQIFPNPQRPDVTISHKEIVDMWKRGMETGTFDFD